MSLLDLDEFTRGFDQRTPGAAAAQSPGVSEVDLFQVGAQLSDERRGRSKRKHARHNMRGVKEQRARTNVGIKRQDQIAIRALKEGTTGLPRRGWPRSEVHEPAVPVGLTSPGEIGIAALKLLHHASCARRGPFGFRVGRHLVGQMRSGRVAGGERVVDPFIDASGACGVKR